MDQLIQIYGPIFHLQLQNQVISPFLLCLNRNSLKAFITHFKVTNYFDRAYVYIYPYKVLLLHQ